MIADSQFEPSERFLVTLKDPKTKGIDFGTDQAIGVIINDDRWVPPPVFRGDPHLMTWDGLAYDFQAVGEFVLAETTASSEMALQARTAPVGDLASKLTAVAALIDGHRVTIDALTDEPLRIDGDVVALTAESAPILLGDASIVFNGSAYLIEKPGNVLLAVDVLDDRLDLSAELAPALAGRVRGLLGNFDADPGDDLALLDGTVLPLPVPFGDLYGAFADAWRVTPASSLFDYAPGYSTDTYTDRNFPRAAVSLDMLPAALVTEATRIVDEAGITDPVHRAAAILDIALSGDPSYAVSALGWDVPAQVLEVSETPTLMPVISVLGRSSTLAEGDLGTTDFVFDIYRTVDTNGSIEVFYEVSGVGVHPATASDFGGRLPFGTINFADGEEHAVVTVAVTGDTDSENNEHFRLTIVLNPTLGDGILIGAATAAATIENDDGALLGRLDVTPVFMVMPEGDTGTSTFSFEVVRSENTVRSATVDWAINGTSTHQASAEDFVGGVYPTGTVRFLSGQERATVTIQIAGDALREEDEAFSVKLSNPTDATIGVDGLVGIIVNDDLPPPVELAIAVRDAVKAEGNSDTTAFTFVVSRTGDTSAETSVDYSISGLGIESANAADFGGALPTGKLVFAANETDKLLTIGVSGDTAVERDETFRVTLGNATNGNITTASADGTIQNDDLAPPPELVIVARDAAAAEGDSGTTTFAFAVTRTGDRSQPTTVSYAVAGAGSTPADPTDFGGTLPTGTISFAAGEDEKLISIAVSGDTTVEHDEGFVVTLADVTNGTLITANAAGTIQNDDLLPPPELAIAARDAVKAEGDSGTTTLALAVTRTGDLRGCENILPSPPASVAPPYNDAVISYAAPCS